MKRKSEKTAEKILTSAVKIFAEKGYAATTTSEIAKEADVAEGTIFRYYPKKKDLLTKVVYKFLDTFGEQVIIRPLEKILDDHLDDGVEVILKEIINDRVKLFERYHGNFKILINEMQYHEDIMEIFKSRVLLSGVQFGDRLIQELKNRDEIRDVNNLLMFRTFFGSVGIMLFQRHFVPSVTTGLTLEEEIDAMIDIFMYGIKNQSKEVKSYD